MIRTISKKRLLELINITESYTKKIECLIRQIEETHPSAYNHVSYKIPERDELIAIVTFLNDKIKRYPLILGLYDNEKLN